MSRDSLITLGIILALAIAGGAAVYVKGRQDAAHAAAPKIEAATDHAVAADLSLAAQHQLGALERAAADQRATTAAALATLTTAASAAGDAHAPLDPDRASRLAAADRSLCDTRPQLVGCDPPH